MVKEAGDYSVLGSYLATSRISYRKPDFNGGPC